MNRFDYIKTKLGKIVSPSKESYYLVTTLEYKGQDEDDRAPELWVVDFGDKTSTVLPYPIREEIEAIEFEWHLKFSLKCKRAYREGDENAIFSFCKLDKWAFKEKWVVNQIESWRAENTKSSRDKLRKLMICYTDKRGQTTRKKLIKYIKRDMEIYFEIDSMLAESSKPPIEGCINYVAQERSMTYETMREIYWEFRAINELIKILVSRFRRMVAVSSHSPVPIMEDIDPELRDLFNLGRTFENFDKELEIYKEMKYLLEKIEYLPKCGLHRKPSAAKQRTGNDLKSIISKIAKRENKPFDEIKNLYFEYSKWELYIIWKTSRKHNT